MIIQQYSPVLENCVRCAKPLWSRLTHSFLQTAFLAMELQQMACKHSNVLWRKSWKSSKDADAISFKIPVIKCNTTAATPEDATQKKNRKEIN